jgi:tol-pal system protein YbgF
MRARLLLPVLLLFPVLGGCATKRDIRDLSTEVEAMRSSQEASMQALRAEVQRANAMLMDSVSLHDARLRGDLMNRLVQLERQLVQIQELSGQSQQGLSTLRQELRQRDEEARRALAEVTDSSGGVSVSGADPDELLASSKAALQRGSYASARAGFEEFVRSFPQNPRAAEAQLAIGETYEKAKDTAKALDAYQRVLELYPDSPRAPTALYRSANLEKGRGNDDRARSMLNQIVVAYPKSPEATQAKADLAKRK